MTLQYVPGRSLNGPRCRHTPCTGDCRKGISSMASGEGIRVSRRKRTKMGFYD